MGSIIVGAAYHLPDAVIDTDSLGAFIQDSPSDNALRLLAVHERRGYAELDMVSGEARLPRTGPVRCATDAAVIVAREALSNAGISPEDVTRLLYVTSTPDTPTFSMDAHRIKARLGLPLRAEVLAADKGCNGAAAMLKLADEILRGNRNEVFVIVALQLAMCRVNREIYRGKYRSLPCFIFGDGAAAVVVRWDDARPGILATYNESYLREDFVHYRVGGNLHPPYASWTKEDDQIFALSGKVALRVVPDMIERCVHQLLDATGMAIDDIDRFYLHQINGRLVELVAKRIGLPLDRVPIHAKYLGNTSAASTPILLGQDLEAGLVKLGGGQRVLFATPGAGAELHGCLVEL